MKILLKGRKFILYARRENSAVTSIKKYCILINED